MTNATAPFFSKKKISSVYKGPFAPLYTESGIVKNI